MLTKARPTLVLVEGGDLMSLPSIFKKEGIEK